MFNIKKRKLNKTKWRFFVMCNPSFVQYNNGCVKRYLNLSFENVFFGHTNMFANLNLSLSDQSEIIFKYKLYSVRDDI